MIAYAPSHVRRVGEGLKGNTMHDISTDDWMFIVCTMSRIEADLHSRIRDMMDKWSVPILAITVGAWQSGWREIRWTPRWQRWVRVMASCPTTRRPMFWKPKA